MDRRSRRATAAVLLVAVVLAGCGGSLPGVGERESPPTPTPTLTPVSVPQETDPTEEQILAPGLSVEGVFDDDALVSAHRTALTARGFLVVRNRTVFRPDTTGDGPRTLNTVGITAVVEPGATSYRFARAERSAEEWPIAGPYTLFVVWYGGDLVRYRFVDDGDARYWGRDHVGPGGPMLDPTDSEDAGRDLSAVDLRVVGNRSVNGTRVYRLRGTGFDEPTELVFQPLLSAPRNATMVATIDNRGIVRSYTLTFDATFAGERVRVRNTHRVTRLGTATVGRPGWLTEANRSVSGRRG